MMITLPAALSARLSACAQQENSSVEDLLGQMLDRYNLPENTPAPLIANEHVTLSNGPNVQRDEIPSEDIQPLCDCNAEMLQTLFDHIPVMIMRFTHKGQMLLINRYFDQTLGWTLTELTDRGDLVPLFYDHDQRRISDHVLHR